MALSVGDIAADTDTLTSDWIAETQRHLRGTQHTTLNTLSADVGHETTEIPVTFPFQNLQAGSILCIDLEVMQVWSVDTGAKTATVLRGVHGSVPAPHAQGTLVQVNARFTDYEVFRALNHELGSLTADGIYQIRTLDLTAVAGQWGYDFPTTGFLQVAEIRWQIPGTVTNQWELIDNYELSYNLPDTTFPSGTALFLEGKRPTAQQTIRVRYKARLGLLTALSENVETTSGIPNTALDVPPMGAALRLMNGRPIGRAQYDAQGDTRRPDEVRVSEVLQAPAALRAFYSQRVAEEADRLREQWPDRTRARVTL